MDAAFNAAIEFKGKPTAIIAKSVKGKGVSFMENQCSWHGKAPNEEQRTKRLWRSSTLLSQASKPTNFSERNVVLWQKL